MEQWRTVPGAFTAFSSPDEGYSTASSSPDLADSSFFIEDQESRCCTLRDGTWRWLTLKSLDTRDPRRVFADHIFAELERPVPLPRFRRAYNTKNSRAIISLDAESINPRDAEANLQVEETGEKLYTRKPWGVAVNSRTEQIYVADRYYNVIMVFRPDGQFEFQFGGPGDKAGEFNRPTALAYDVVGDRLFVVDKDNHRIQVFDPIGRFLFQFGTKGRKPGSFSWPWGISVSRNGVHVAIADARNHRVQLFKTDGTYLRNFSMLSKGALHKHTFDYPRGIAFDNSGQYIYVTDFNNHCVLRLDLSLSYLEMIVGNSELCRPSGIDVDAAGNLVVCDSKNNALKIFQPDGRFIVAKYFSVGTARFDLPLDVAVMPAGYLAVLDLNGRVQIF